MHFVHHVPFFNHFLGYIFPVTESVMAHMKMVFYPMLLLSIYLCISRRDIREIGAPILGALAVMPLIVAAFFGYWVFVRHELMLLDIVIYIASMVGAVHLATLADMCCCATPLAVMDSAHRAGYHYHRHPDLPRTRLDHLRRFRII